jgi:KUP system potassium uptake protein
MSVTDNAASDRGADTTQAHGSFAALTVGAVGVVFGDIGTSPLYAFKVAIGQAARSVVHESDVLGIISLMLWALTIVVTVKYAIFLMRADNRGEGGMLSLMALAQHALGGRTRVVLALGVCGAGLFYGDAMITPAMSVLSAVEGLRTVPALAHLVTPAVVIMISLIILVGLFLVQSRGTAKVASWFGPICLVWFAALLVLGLAHVLDAPRVFLALNPLYGLEFLARNGLIGLFVLGSVSLTITGAEALYADMGHFGRGPIRLGWSAIVFPALALNYLGQGAAALRYIAGPGAQAHIADRDWFFTMAPEFARAPLVILATLATIVASQAVITGAFSLSSQAMQLGLLPRLNIRRTSETQAGQIYLPTINFLLMSGVILLVGIFKSSENMANAYGLAVTGTMAVDTAMAGIVVRRLWKWPLWRTSLVIAPLLLVDLTFFAANSLKLVSGAWVSLAMGASASMVIATWMRGRRVLADKERRDRIPLKDFIASLNRRPRHRVPGIAVYLSPDLDLTPSALMHNLKHNGVLHELNAVISVRTADEPWARDRGAPKIESLGGGFVRIMLIFGYMERPDVPRALGSVSLAQFDFDPLKTSYFLAHRTIVSTHARGLPRFRDRLFIALDRNSANPSEYFNMPAGQVVEMGYQVAV